MTLRINRMLCIKRYIWYVRIINLQRMRVDTGHCRLPRSVHDSLASFRWSWDDSDFFSTLRICMFSLVPRPHPQKEERVWYTSSTFWVLLTWHVWILLHQSESRHVAYMWYRAIASYCCSWEQLMRRYAKTMRCHDSHMTSCIMCAQESTQCVPDPFLTCVVGSGNETNACLAAMICAFLWYPLTLWL